MVIDLKTVALTLIAVFLFAMFTLVIVFLKALFKFPSLRHKLWHGITNGDMNPTISDFQRTSQLFWAYVFGIVLIVFLGLYAAFPEEGAWIWICGFTSATFVACIGLRSLNFSKH